MMMSKPNNTPPGNVNADLVAFCQQLLDLAKSGRVQNALVVARVEGESSHFCFVLASGDETHDMALVGGVEIERQSLVDLVAEIYSGDGEDGEEENEGGGTDDRGRGH